MKWQGKSAAFSLSGFFVESLSYVRCATTRYRLGPIWGRRFLLTDRAIDQVFGDLLDSGVGAVGAGPVGPGEDMAWG
ncbi:MAG: hypothetical protein RI963_2674 [Planctomycetota bacterium]